MVVCKKIIRLLCLVMTLGAQLFSCGEDLPAGASPLLVAASALNVPEVIRLLVDANKNDVEAALAAARVKETRAILACSKCST